MSGSIHRFRSDSLSLPAMSCRSMQWNVAIKQSWRAKGAAGGAARLNVNIGEQEVA